MRGLLPWSLSIQQGWDSRAHTQVSAYTKIAMRCTVYAQHWLCDAWH